MTASDIRNAVAVVVRRDGGLVLAVKRPDEPGEELPGVWGLPATTLRDGEAAEAAIARLGREKLGVALVPLRSLAEGDQPREDYMLRMTVYEASMDGEPRPVGRPRTGARLGPSGRLPDRTDSAVGTLYDALDWLPAESFRAAAEAGSLCCALFLDSLTPGPFGYAQGRPYPSEREG